MPRLAMMRVAVTGRLSALVLICAAAIVGSAATAAKADISYDLYRKALYSTEVRLKLMAAGVLNAASDTVPSEHIKDAAKLFVRTYFAGETPDLKAQLARLDEIDRQYKDFSGLADSSYDNNVIIKIPAKLLAEVTPIRAGVETRHVSGDSAEALKFGTFRYPLRAQTPQSLLREIFYRNQNLVVEAMQSDENLFQVSGFLVGDNGDIDHHFLRKAFQVGDSTTAVYIQYDHVAPSTFVAPAFFDPLVDKLTPPRALFELEDAEQRHAQLLDWVAKSYTPLFALMQPPESVTAVRRDKQHIEERIENWRTEHLDSLGRDIFEVAVEEDLDERLAKLATWRRNVSWRLTVRAAANISSAEFDAKNGWKNVAIRDCHASFKSNETNPDYHEVRIVFATNRERGLELNNKKARGKRFNIKRLFLNKADANDHLHYGCVFVTVPRDRKAERQRETHVYESWGWQERERPTDLKKYYSIRQYAYLGNSGENARGERVRLVDGERRWSEREHMALLYVHGYNTAFHESLLRVAQIAAASRYAGRVYLFSWPSARSASSYVADMDASEKSDPYLAAFVQTILLDAKITQLDVLAHSMGGQMFLRAFSRFRSSFDQVKKVRFGKVIFAAPDVSQSVFKEKINDIAPYTRGKQGVSVYASSLDRVLLLSSFLRGGRPRAGDLSRDTILDKNVVNIIDATRASWWCDPSQYSFLGHTYFSNQEAVLRDIIAQLIPSWKRSRTQVTRYTGKHTCWYQSKTAKAGE